MKSKIKITRLSSTTFYKCWNMLIHMYHWFLWVKNVCYNITWTNNNMFYLTQIHVNNNNDRFFRKPQTEACIKNRNWYANMTFFIFYRHTKVTPAIVYIFDLCKTPATISHSSPKSLHALMLSCVKRKGFLALWSTATLGQCLGFFGEGVDEGEINSFFPTS